MTNTTAPDGEASQPGAVHFECPEAALGHSIKQSQCVEYSNRSPPNTEIVSGFTPLNPPLSASSVSPVAAAQHYSPTEPGFITFTGSVPRQIHPAGSLLSPAHSGYQQDPRAGGGPQATGIRPNPFSGPPRFRRAWLHQNPFAYYHHHTINTDIAGPTLSAQQFGGGQAVEGSSSSVRVIKGKGKLIEVPPEVLEVHSSSPSDESFEETIRRTAMMVMGLVNIHRFD
jgi:hypothetical protein